MRTVLFVCVHNAGRSQMAEAFLRHLLPETTALSAGTMGAGSLNPVAIEAMREIGVPMDGHTPKLLTEDMVARADRIVSMGCGVDADACPVRFMVTEDWGLDDPAGKGIEEVRRVRDAVRARVEALAAELAAS